MATAPLSQTQTCTKCGTVKPLEDFPKATTGVNGRRGDCRVCRRKYCKDWYSGLPDEQKKARQAREGKREWQAAYYQRNKEQYREAGRRWVAENKEKQLASTRSAMRKMRSTTKGRLHSNISAGVRRGLKSRKHGSTFDILGYSVDQLLSHVERQFLRGMTWDNYGDWHIDHIRPLASFDYETTEDPQFREAWALVNLRPMWAKDNIRKSATRIYLI